MYKATQDFLWFKKGQEIPEPQQNWMHLVELVPNSVEEPQEIKAEETIQSKKKRK